MNIKEMGCEDSVCLLIWDRDKLWALMSRMTSVNSFQTTQLYISEDSILQDNGHLVFIKDFFTN
jgi:hypothetical protein